MSNPLQNSKYSVSNSRRHIRGLEAEIVAFFKSDPYARVVDFDPNGHDDIHKLKLVKPMPELLSGLAFDAVSNLRAALDQAGHTIGVAAGASGKNSAFPFGDTLAEVKSRAGAGSRDIPKPLFDLMVASGPYKGGNDLLWALNKLCNLHKHEIIIPMAIYTGSAWINNAYFSAVKSFSFPPTWDAAKQEMVLAIVPHCAPLSYDMKIATFVAMAKVEGVIGKPAVAVLDDLANIVDDIVAKLEAEGVKLGILK
jgi:hypothetical protein